MKNTKLNFIATAMRCTQEQFEELRPILEKNGLKIYSIDDFDKFCYLVNNYAGEEKKITNLHNYNKSSNNREVIEVYNKNTFLNSCGIETDTYTISKDVILKYEMKEEFPELFVPTISKKQSEKLLKELGHNVKIK